jgi:hypothetical protein
VIERPGFPIKLPETRSEYRHWHSWIGEVSRRPFATSGVALELLDTEAGEPTCGDAVHTTSLWTEINEIPVQHAVISKIAYTQTGKRMAFVYPRGPSLLPVAGLWLPTDDLEADDA